MKLILYALAAVWLLTGCATPRAPLSTSSGRPEVMVTGVTKKQVMDLLVEAGLSNGLQVRNANEYGVTLTKKSTDLATAIIYGSRYDSTPEFRVHFNMVESQGGMRVFARGEVVTNPGSGFERVNDVTQNEGHAIQSMLEQLRTRVSPSNYPVPPPTASSGMTKPSVSPQVPTQTASPSSTGRATGEDTINAERVAREQHCAEQPRASLLSKGPGYESYSVACTSGDTMVVRCEFGNCRTLK